MSSFDPFSYQNLFYKHKIKVTDEEINQILTILKHDKFKNEEQSSTFYSLNILNFPLLKNLRKQIVDILNDKKLYLTNNWAQLYNKNDAHEIHTHANSIFSGIIYLSETGSPTLFYDRNFNSFKNLVEKNVLILFPSWIPHEVKPLTNNENRLIISFNTTNESSI